MSAKKFLDFSGLLSYHDNLISLIRNDEQVIAQAIEGLASDLEADEEVIATALNDLKETLDEIESNAATISDVNALPGTSSEISVETLVEIEDAVEGAETVDADLNGSVISITNRNGQTKSIDVLRAVEFENVTIAVTTSVQGVSVSGLTLYVYYNGASVPSVTLTTDENGRASLQVPNGYQYRIVFPSVQGCLDIPDVTHTALMAVRSVEVEYVDHSVDSEMVRIFVRRRETGSYTVISGATVYITIDGSTTEYTANSDGVVELYIQHGKTYTVSVPAIADVTTPTSVVFTSEKVVRIINMTYKYSSSGLFIVDSLGGEYTPEQWQAAVQAGTRQNTDAKLIVVATDVLINKGGVFALDIDKMAYGGLPSATWSSSFVLFTSIPENGNSTNEQYYYDGYGASKAIQKEGDDRNVGTPAVDVCLALSITTGEETHQGFLPSVGQYVALWGNRYAIDDIVDIVRPDRTFYLNNYTNSKWTSTQYNASSAYFWTTIAVAYGTYGKNLSCVVLPAFAY